jgi:hypothetical protein
MTIILFEPEILNYFSSSTCGYFISTSEITFFSAVLVFELRAYSLSHYTSPFLFVFVFFSKIVSFELFAWAGFKPRAS